MEIKPREIIFSVVIIAVLLVAGFAISNSIRQHLLEKYQEYDSGVKIDNEEIFRYGMRTNIGNGFAYGKLGTVDPVTFPEIGGQYSYVRKEEQEYRRHSRIVTETYTDSDGNTHTRTKMEYYWTWDTMRIEKKHASKITFLNVEFDYKKIPFPSSRYITTIDTGYHQRNEYYGTGTYFHGTIYAVLKDKTIYDASFYQDMTIPETIEHLESGYELLFFWIAWVFFIVIAVIGFYFLENRWLD